MRRNGTLEVDLQSHLDKTGTDLDGGRTAEVGIGQIGIDTAEERAIKGVRDVRAQLEIERLFTGSDFEPLHQRDVLLIDGWRAEVVQIGGGSSKLERAGKRESGAIKPADVGIVGIETGAVDAGADRRTGQVHPQRRIKE